MLRSITLPFLLCAGTALAQGADFEAANRSLQEQSYRRACDGFTAYLKANPDGPLAREAQAKRLIACLEVGSGSWDALRKFGTEGEKDFARARAAAELSRRGGLDFEQVLPLLKQAAQAEGRQGAEARALLVAGCLRDMESRSYEPARVARRYDELLAFAGAEDAALGRLRRARAWLNQDKALKAKAAEELLAIGKGSTSVADDALDALAQTREQEGNYVAALELDDTIVARFSPTTSNVLENARARAQNIRRPVASLSVQWMELPGTRPHAVLNFRNITSAQWSLRPVDPAAMQADRSSDPEAALQATAGAPVASWSTALKAPGPFAPGTFELDLETKAAGLYLLEVQADGSPGPADRELVFITPHVTVLKVGRSEAITFTADAITGEAVSGAAVVLFRDGENGRQKLTATADATGLARFPLTGKRTGEVFAYAKGQGTWSMARGYGNGWRQSATELLGWGMTDRPLYKPGEAVALKFFLRSREDGPSVPVPGEEVTLRVRDPSGREAFTTRLATNTLGTATAGFTLAPDAQLGQWSCQLSGTARSFSSAPCSFRVEEYKPPEVTVRVEPVGNPKPGEVVKLKVSAGFFFGGPVANAQGRALVTVRPWAHRFAPWPDEVLAQQQASWRGRRGYDDEEYGYYGNLASHTVPFKTGADGTAIVEVPATAGLAAQDLSYDVQVFVTDASRREVSGSGSVKVSRAEAFFDLRSDRFLYKPGEKLTVKLRAEDPNGRPVSREVEVRLVKVDGGGKVASGKARLEGGAGQLTLDADALGPARLELVDPKQPEAVLASGELWLTQENRPVLPKAEGFMVFSDRVPLKVGGTVRALVIGATAGGHALVTLETERIDSAQVVALNGRARLIELPLTAALAPNAWLGVQRVEALQVHQTLVPLQVTGSNVELPVAVRWPKATVEPGNTLQLTVEPGAGLPAGLMTETAVTVVDASLYAIEPERTGFLSYFGRRPRTHEVSTSNSVQQRQFRPKPVAPQPVVARARPNEVAEVLAEADLGASGAPAPTRMLAAAESARREGAKEKKAVAKDEDKADMEEQRAPGGAPQPKVRTNFSTSSGWYAALPGRGSAPITQAVKFTDSLTQWKATAYVVTAGPQLGVGSAVVRAEKPLMVRLQAPRFFTERDEVTLSAIASSRLPTATDVEVVLSAPGLKALGESRRTVRVEPGADVRVDARFRVEEPGLFKVRASATGGGKGDAMEWALPAVVHGSAQRQFFSGRLSDRFSLDFEVPARRKPSQTRFELVLSPSLLAVTFDALPYLAAYPYGCVEQTLSRFVPAAIAAKAARDLGAPSTRVPAELDAMVKAGLKRLLDFQHGDGGWGWWQTDATNPWMTAYVVYGLSLGREAGLAIDEGVIARGRSWLVQHLGAALNQSETHAFMVYALARTGAVPKAALDADFKVRTRLSARSRALLALALLAQKDPRARIAVENLDDVVVAAKGRADASVGEADTAWGTSAAIEATAWTLMAMATYAPDSPNVKLLTDFLVLRRNGGKWRTTRDTAFAVYALAELARIEKATTRSGSFVVKVNGVEVKRLAYSAGGLDLQPLVLGDSAFKPGPNRLEVLRDGGGTGHFAASLDVFNMNDFIKGVGGDVTVKRTYTLLGKPSTEKASAPTEYGMPVESGVRVRVDLEVTANKAVEFVMLEDLKPAGFEAVLQKSGPEVCNYACAHAELRTDRVAMFLTELPVGKRTLSYELRAEVPGKFSALPARFEAMYAPEIQATSDEMRFEVRDAPTAGVAGAQ